VFKKMMRNYGMVFVLLGLCVLFSILTLKEQSPDSNSAAEQIIEQVNTSFSKDDIILTVGAWNKDSEPFAFLLNEKLKAENYKNVITVTGIPRDLKVTLDSLKENGKNPAAIATGGDVLKWRIVELLPQFYPEFKETKVIAPETYLWPDFLKRGNLLAIVDRIVVIAIIAIGMTMVIITGGIDLSVGSLIAVSAVISTVIMKMMGGLQASGWAVFVGFIVGIIVCGLIGGFGGYLVAKFKVPSFITTLGIMLMGRGLAFMITGGFSIYQVPDEIIWLGQGTTIGIPNTVILLVLLYFIAHVFMTHTKTGRHIYAVGGNEEAARLSGVPVKFIVVLVFVISVIQNGMNLLGMESYTQQVVLGFVILIAVLLDKLRDENFLFNFKKRYQV